MKLTSKSVLSATALLVGGFIGASALVVLASGGSTWTPAPNAPSTCISGTQGCDAPINVGPSNQAKLGNLALGTSTAQTAVLDVEGTSWLHGLIVNGNGTFQYIDGNQANGKVLQSDTNGNAKWVATSSLGIVGSVQVDYSASCYNKGPYSGNSSCTAMCAGSEHAISGICNANNGASLGSSNMNATHTGWSCSAYDGIYTSANVTGTAICI